MDYSGSQRTYQTSGATLAWGDPTPARSTSLVDLGLGSHRALSVRYWQGIALSVLDVLALGVICWFW